MTIKANADIVVVTESFLNNSVEPTFGKIRGYSHWQRRDRKGKNGGGIAVCFRPTLQLQALAVDIPDWLEASFFKVILSTGNALLLCALYRPQRQGRLPLDYLNENLDSILTANNCQHTLIVGDLNYHLVQTAYDDLLDVHNLVDHVDFPTHILGGTLDPVISDLPPEAIKCSSLGKVGSSDHFVVETELQVRPKEEEEIERKIWLWDRANWSQMKAELSQVDWDIILCGDANSQAQALTNLIISLQDKYVPSRTYTSKPGDQPWFGFRCRNSAEHKYKMWRRYKRHPTRHNRRLYTQACKEMTSTSKWAKRRWENELKQKLSNPNIEHKQWWTLVKDIQGHGHDTTIPPLNKRDGTVAANNQQKADVLGQLFSQKMRVAEPDRTPPTLPTVRHADTLTNIRICRAKVRKLLQGLNTRKAIGLDNVSPHTLKKCSSELAEPLSVLFETCLRENCWPSIWKQARVVPVHKKLSKSEPGNYRPISLLSVISKVFEKILADEINQFLEDNNILSQKQFGFRASRSTADLLLLSTQQWQNTLDAGRRTLVVALDIAGAFDRVWHRGLVEKMRAKGIQGNLLSLLQDYLVGRTMQVVIGGQSSHHYPVEASVPQGSVLGPIMWNIYINDLLQELPELSAYADDCTLAVTYARTDQEEVATDINAKLKAISDWGKRCQVSFAAHKTQCMVVSRSPEAMASMTNKLVMDSMPLSIKDSISILGVEIDWKLKFDKHIKKICNTASFKISSLRRVAHLLDARGILTLYKAQIRPHLEYSSLAWMSCTPSTLNKLDEIQRRALQLV